MNNPKKILFTRNNYLILLAGIGLIILGFIVMEMETAPYGFGALGLTIGPLLVMAGFIVEFFAIFYKPKN